MAEREVEGYLGNRVSFSYYNSAFVFFNDSYVELCKEISSSRDVRLVRRKVTAFMYEFFHSLKSNSMINKYKERLHKISDSLQQDTDYIKFLNKQETTFKEEAKQYKTFYHYFLQYLTLVSDYVAETTAIYFPRMLTQETRLKWKNDISFYQKFHEFKRSVYETTSNYEIKDFRIAFNTMVTYLYAYRIFINDYAFNRACSFLSLGISLCVHDEFISVIQKYPDYSNEDLSIINKLETLMQESISEAISSSNASLSSYGILPKEELKLEFDKTLI